MLREEIIFKDNFETVDSCCFCHESTHLIQTCPKLHFIPDHEFLYKKINYSSFQKRASFQRKNRKSCHALKNNEEIEENVVNISTSLYMHYLDQIPEMESQIDIEDTPSPKSSGVRQLSKRKFSLSAVNEDSSSEEDELEKNTMERVRQLKPTKIIVKPSSRSSFSFNELQETEFVNFHHLIVFYFSGLILFVF